MTSSRLVRGAKTRMFAFVCLVCVLGAVLFVFHGTQVRLTETQKQLVTCSQQKESFHAQLQVIFEYKERLEKSLNKEKTDHKLTKEDLEKKIKDDKEQLESDFASKTDVLQQKNNNLQGQLEELRETNEKLLNEKTRLSASLELTKKEVEAQKVKNDEDAEKLKNDWFKKHEECLQMSKQLEEYKMRDLPESDRRNYLEKQTFQIKEENEKLKHELSECRADKKPSAAPSLKNENEENAPNVAPMFKTFSSTPGINPDAVNGASSAKPSENSKKDEHAVGSMPKKPTQESVVPLIQPRKVDDLGAGQGQIPIPPNPHPLGILHKPNIEPEPEANNIQLPEDSEDNLIKQEQAKAQIAEPNAFIPDANRAEEEDEQAPQFKPPGKNPESYRAGDYDKEQPEEEDEEGELIDDEGDHLKDRKLKILRQNQPRNGGVMVNPK